MLRARVSRSRLTAAVTDKEPKVSTRRMEKKAPPRSRALSAETLEQLGAARLAEILMAQTIEFTGKRLDLVPFDEAL
jgi:hypothetical protein